jgi:iron(III) transport system substrate-binding protein
VLYVPPGVLIVFLMVAVLVGSSCRDRAGRREVVLYCSVDQAVAEPLVAEFERQTAIRVLARYDTEASKTVGLVQRIRAQAAAPTAQRITICRNLLKGATNGTTET